MLKLGAVGAGTLRSSLALPLSPAGRVQVVDARTLGLVDPLAIGAVRPCFSWRVSGLPEGQGQTHYRITIARSRSGLAREVALLWDSGRVASPACYDIPYVGPQLGSRAHLWWTVRIWHGDDGASVAGPISRFETGLAEESDWSAQWIAAEDRETLLDRQAGLFWLGCDPRQKQGEINGFRSVIDAPDAANALLLISAIELAGIWLNGAELQADQEEPVAWTSMAPFRLRLRRGRNVLAVAVRHAQVWGVPQTAMAAIIRWEGREERLTTRTGWRSMLTPPSGWQEPTFDDHQWPSAIPANKPPDGQPWLPGAATHLRGHFFCPGPVRSARLYATALGVYEPWINGSRVGDVRLAPGWTDPSQRILYQAYDVTEHVQVGENVLGLWVGDGWYASEFSTRSRFPFGAAPCRVRAQLELDYVDGSKQIVGTDDGWLIRSSPILSSEIYDGEVYDARKEVVGWAAHGSVSGWDPARVVEPPSAAVEPELCAPIRVTQAMAPIAVHEAEPGVHIFDFGQNFAGWAQLNVTGNAGATVEMRFGEVLGPSGLVDQSNLRSALARDRYVLKGSGREVWEPRFTYHGFRYVEVRGLPGSPAPDTLLGKVVHTDLPLTGTFRTGDRIIQQFWRNALWSQRSNFYGLPTDCPQRDERLGWMGDAQVFWPAAAYNMDVQAYTRRVMRDVRAAQAADGRLPDVIPYLLRSRMTTSPGWADAGIILPFTAWRQYGDCSVVAENWSAMNCYMSWIERHNPSHIWLNKRGQDFGDWLAVDANEPGDPTTPKDLIATAFWASNAWMMAQMALALDLADEATRYDALLRSISSAFQSRFVRADGSIGNGSQTGYVLALRFGLVPLGLVARAGDRLAADIAARGNSLSTGFLGTPHILDALAISGHADVAVTLLMQRRFPSWGYMVEQGATTMWERWNSDRGDRSMNSFNHYAFGAISDFLFRRIAGIAAREPGFRRVRVAPIVDRRLGGAGADYRSVSGDIRVDWGISGDHVHVEIMLPSSVSGEFLVPPGTRLRCVDGRRATDRQGLSPVPLAPGRHDLRLVLGD